MQVMLRTLVALALLCFVGGCAKKTPEPSGPGGGHEHTAPHGGKLVELGDHAYNLEFILDATAGKLTAFVLDDHADSFIRIKSPSFAALATAGGEQRPLLFRAVANTATGETVGDTSQFEVQADWLKTTPAFELEVGAIEIRGANFSRVSVSLSSSVAKP